MNFFFLFLGRLQLDLDRNITRMMFFNFLNFLAIFFGILYPGSSRIKIRNEIYFSLSPRISAQF